jgi:solute carrier family 25, member 33/36
MLLTLWSAEVLRTRLRESAPGQPRKYHGLLQSLRIIVREEGVRALYGGMQTHLIRSLPNAAILFLTFELMSRSFPAAGAADDGRA